MITSIDIIHELLTTIYCSIFSRNRKNILKYDVLLYLDDYYYFDILKKVSADIKEIDKDSFLIEEKQNFNAIFTDFCKRRNYIIKDKTYTNESEKRIDFLHEILSDLLCLLFQEGTVNASSSGNDGTIGSGRRNNDKGKIQRVIHKTYNYEINGNWRKIENQLVEIESLSTHKKRSNITDYMNENNVKEILNITKENFKNDDIIIKENINKDTEKILKSLIEKYNNAYELRFYYIFLNNYLTIQTMFMSPLINFHSKEIKGIIKKIIEIKNTKYYPITIYDILSFQYDQIKFYKSSHNNLKSPVKKIKIMDNIVERGGMPTEFSKKIIMKDVINANVSLKNKYNKSRKQNDHSFGGKYKVRNYYDSSRG
ncbi:hypothetical protein MKS88_005735 [Plasmodium brasilianum]|uniref:Uncharacterized protein n=2 Tax=Plasmodium (Plasmodium) TaxID=418103 RepID=A0A1A8WIQ2_PLAMA|nr:conserved Plasmodium protein, unknown function [Plasmodium malariae]KAI4835052.1 hypothetical protein MKS88_005735 [Plasmodium brasilianum]SBS91123.1 conserved Plasmodium protein, unknown function [Plasmodium malariae]SCP03627.1 conserved Plasmodium protein, unknown function [Plasmodium malariae]